MRVREGAAWLLALGGIGAAAFLATRTAAPPVAAQFLVQLPESVSVASNSATSIALARDGSELAILGEKADKAGRAAIYLRRLDDPEGQLVRGTEGALYPSFSPDGRWLLFTVGAALEKVPVEGGTPQTLADSGARGSWGDGGSVLYTKPTDNSIWLVASDGGGRRLVARPDSSRKFMRYDQSDLLPGGQYALISVLRWGGFRDSSRIGLLSLADGSIRDLGIQGFSPHYAAPGHVLFARSGGLVFSVRFSLRTRATTGPPVLIRERVRQSGGNGLATGFTVAQNGTMAYDAGSFGDLQTMYVVDPKGVERPLKGPMQLFKEPRVSPDGRRIAVRLGTNVTDGGLWIYDLAAGTLTRLTPDSNDIRGEWTRDGSRVVYVMNRVDSEFVVSRPWDGNGAPTVLARGGPNAFHSVSVGPAHGLSAIRRGSTPAEDIFLAPTDSLSAVRPFVATPADEFDPHVSRNGRLLAYTSSETGRDEVYLLQIPGPGPRVQVSVDGGDEPTWSADGATLFYRGPARMMAATVTEHPALAVTRRDSLFVDTYRRYNWYAAYDVFPNGDFLMTNGPAAASRIFVIVNWPQLIQKQAAGAGAH